MSLDAGVANSETKGLILSVPSSQLHAPPQVPEHADRIQRIDHTRTHTHGSPRCTTANVLKAKMILECAAPPPRHRRHPPLPLFAAGTPSGSSARGAYPLSFRPRQKLWPC